MLNKALLKRNMRTCYKLFLAIFALLFLYTTVIIYMYDPELSKMLESFQEALPEMMSAVGMSGVASSLLEWMQIYLYGFIMLLFPLIFIIFLVNKLLMSYVDSGSLANLLTTPTSRLQIVRTQLFSLLLWLTLLMCAISTVGIVTSELLFPGQLDMQGYILLNGCTLLLWFAIATFAFVVACFASDAKTYYSLGAGIPVVCFFFHMLGNMQNSFSFFRYVSIYTLLPASEIIAKKPVFMPVFILVLMSVVLSVVGCRYFQRRDFFL